MVYYEKKTEAHLYIQEQEYFMTFFFFFLKDVAETFLSIFLSFFIWNESRLAVTF